MSSDWRNSSIWMESDGCFHLWLSLVVLFKYSGFSLSSGASKVNDKVYFACRFECVCHSMLALRGCKAIVVCNSAHVEMDPTSPR